jgi:uncharacterized membrane protein YedE/YeeE
MFNFLQNPWPWYIAGPLIGLMVPLLLIMGNKSFGISGTLRHICAACLPNKIPFFTYDWKKEQWNLFFVLGITLGGVVAAIYLNGANDVLISPVLQKELNSYGITKIDGLMPSALFSWQQLFTLRGFILMVFGGFLVGFGTRYAGGCTSGHAIMGLSTLQWPSLVATVCFMLGGFIMANLVMPYILSI